MRSTALIVSLAGLAAAAPQRIGMTANDLKGSCKDITLIFARGTTEPGNMGMIIGPAFAQELLKLYPGKVAVQGVDYPAAIPGNMMRGGADPKGVNDMKSKIESAASKCPNTAIVVSGYSQGAAVTHGAVKALSPDLQERVTVAVTWGDTQKKQENNQIKGFPKDKTLIVCNNGDGVCVGTLILGAAHMSYGGRAKEGSAFAKPLIDAKLSGAKSGASTGVASDTAAAAPAASGSFLDRLRGMMGNN